MRHAELPWPRIEPAPSAMEAWSINHWITKEVLEFFKLLLKLKKSFRLNFWDFPNKDTLILLCLDP